MSMEELMNQIKHLNSRVEELEKAAVSNGKQLYTVAEVANILGVTKEAVYYMIKRGEIPTIKLGTMKIRAIDLDNLLRAI